MHFLRNNSIAIIALFVALGGTSYAAIALPKNSVGSKQIKKNAVTAAKVKNGSLLAADFKSGQLPKGEKGDKGDKGDTGPKGDTGATGATGVQGVQGVQGEQGEQGERGPSDALHLSNTTGVTNLSGSGDTLGTVIMSSGAYVANAKVQLDNAGASTTAVDCILFTSGNAGNPIDKATVDLAADGASNQDHDQLVLQGVSATGSNFLIVNCDDNAGNVNATDIKLTAIQVGTLDD